MPDNQCYSRTNVEDAISNVLTLKVNAALANANMSITHRLNMAIVEAFVYNKGSYIDHNVLRWAAAKLAQGDNLV